MSKGYVAIILHAHLPFVHHPGEENVLEERWLFEALTECYLPILAKLEVLQRDKVPFKITMSLSAPLVSMLDSGLLQQHYVEYLDNLIQLSANEIERTKGQQPELTNLATMYHDRFVSFKDRYINLYQCNLIKPFRALMEAGCLELITCAGTHGYLPLMLTDEAVNAQLGSAIDQFQHYFGKKPVGIWLPECAYRPGIEEMLHSFGVKYFILDAHGIVQGLPQPLNGVYNPVSTYHGVSAFGRDPESARQVWSSKTGYPGDYDYREYYRDIGWDLPWEYMKPFMHPDGFRHNTGIKYHRVTGEGDHKELYNQAIAEQKVGFQAKHFVEGRQSQVTALSGKTGLPPIIVCPYDAELFGHWWFEGPVWLEYVIRKSAYDQQEYELISPSQYMEAFGGGNETMLPISSWGEDGYHKVWLNETNDWIYPHLHQAESQMLELVNSLPHPDALQMRMLQQAGRELLLAQSSDWAFIMYMGTTVDYAKRRFASHLDNFHMLFDCLKRNVINEQQLVRLETANSIFPNLDISCWRNKNSITLLSTEGKRKILMLSWEFPPKTVGGLARHVYDLSRALVRQGEVVHVLTAGTGNSPELEMVEGVVVHRLNTPGDEKEDFFKWVFYLNQAMMDYGRKLSSMVGDFDVIHAHDWLVAYSGEGLKESLGIPLIATIHATEHGRNHGIHNDLQYRIHQVERDLSHNADTVICCSNYMAGEISQGFEMTQEKLVVIPNGVEIEAVMADTVDPAYIKKYAPNGEKLILFVGRLVIEKGVQVLLQALADVKKQYPLFRCLVAGKGPMSDELQHLTAQLGLENQVQFLGFVSDRERNQLLSIATAAVFPSLYEPFGIVALEAMAAGRPVIVADTGGLGEIVFDGINGLKFSPGDIGALARAILALLTREELASHLTQQASSDLKNLYDWDVLATLTSEVYDRVSD